MALRKVPHPERVWKKSRWKDAIGKFSPHFPGESRDPFLRHSELLKQSQYLASEDGLVPRKDRPRLFAGEAYKIAVDDSFTRSQHEGCMGLMPFKKMLILRRPAKRGLEGRTKRATNFAIHSKSVWQ